MKTSLYLTLLILSLNFSCKRNTSKTFKNSKVLDSIYKVEKLDTTIIYKPLSLHFKRKPIFTIGQKLTDVDSSLSFRYDPNSDYQDYFPLIKDYITTEDKLSLYKVGKSSYVTGIVFFSVEQHSQRLFNVSGTWSININNKDDLQTIKKWITTYLFPSLKNKFNFKNKWKSKIETKNRVEKFQLLQQRGFWVLEYNVELR